MHCMNADLSDLLRLLQNLIRLGALTELKGTKARVRLGPTLTTEWLNWATRRAGSTRTWSTPTVARAADGVAMAVQGTIKASEDVLAGAINLTKHAWARASGAAAMTPKCPG